jgi:NADH:ubiquinone oxidoreductase subunit 6 (subunit J)
MVTTRNIYAYILAASVLIVTALGLLGIWDLIQWEDIEEFFWKGVQSLILILFSGAIILFIFSTIYKKENKPPRSPFERSDDKKEAA